MNVTIYTKTGYAYDHVHLSPVQTSTFRRKLLDVDMNTRAEVDVAASIVSTHTSHSTMPLDIDNWTDEEEQEWDNLFAQPHVQAVLSRLAEEAEQQLALGNFEEGGFAVE